MSEIVPVNYAVLESTSGGSGFPPELLKVEEAKRWAEIERIHAETRRVNAETMKIEHEASVASRMSTGARIAEERELYKRSCEQLSDDELRVYRFTGPIHQASQEKAIATLALWERLDATSAPDREYRIVISSMGGGILEGFGLYDFLRSLSAKGHPIVTEAHTIVASMATVIFQAGDRRLIAPGTSFMIHSAAFEAQGGIEKIEDTALWVRALQKRIHGILAERSTLTVAKIAKLSERKEWTVIGPEVVALGFADELL